MAAPQITPLPPAPQRQDSPTDFVTKADAHVASLVGFVTETNALSDNNEVVAASAATSESNALTSESNALTSESSAAISESNAEANMDTAEDANTSIASAAGLPEKTTHEKEVLKVNALETGVGWDKGLQVGVMSTATDSAFYTTPDFLMCDGSIYSSIAYPDLFAVIGTTTLPSISVGGGVATNTYIKASN